MTDLARMRSRDAWAARLVCLAATAFLLAVLVCVAGGGQ